MGYSGKLHLVIEMEVVVPGVQEEDHPIVNNYGLIA